MEIKKTQTSDLQNKKGLFFEIGLAIALVFTLVAFNWVSSDIEHSPILKGVQTVIEEEIVPITTHEPPPPVEMPVLAVSDLIDIVDNAVDIPVFIPFTPEDHSGLGIPEIERIKINKQPKEESFVEEESFPFPNVEVKPSFQGGDPNRFSKWVNSQIDYPASAAEAGIQGTVILFFEIGKDGKLYNIKVLRSIDPLLDQEAVRVVKMSPLWTPGEQQGKKVKVSYHFPVKFQLQ